MEKVSFEPVSTDYKEEIIDILNYYIENSYAAYQEEKVTPEYFQHYLNIQKKYPVFVIKLSKKVIGFCYLNEYHPAESFRETAVITYFLAPGNTGLGVGKQALTLLEDEAKKRGIKHILAHISSVNEVSLSFHKKFGFTKCGEFEGIIKKNGKQFNIVWMQKDL